MDFNRSTQAKSWLFDEDSLAACRERAAVEASSAKNENKPRVRKFASGFHSRISKEREGSPAANNLSSSSVPTLSPGDKETLVRFHAHQIQALVGPTALLAELSTSESVLSSAIMYFRRFYLSNCILDINPRKMAAACAFFAAKAEEERIDVSLMVACVARSIQILLSSSYDILLSVYMYEIFAMIRQFWYMYSCVLQQVISIVLTGVNTFGFVCGYVFCMLYTAM
jgi:hypothetical protein